MPWRVQIPPQHQPRPDRCFTPRQRWCQVRRSGRSLLALLAALLGLSGVLAWPAAAQDGDPPRTTGYRTSIGGVPTQGVPVAERVPRPQLGPRGVRNFVQDLSSHQPDAFFEVVLGRPRILTLKEALGGPEQQAQIAVGDPSVVDFDVLTLRQLRILGLRVGVTDLAIVDAEGEAYVFRIQVVYDLDVLRAQLKAVFPGAGLRLSQVREHIIVEGQARDQPEVARILETIRAYLTSMEAVMGASITESAPAGGTAGPVGGPGGPGAAQQQFGPEGEVTVGPQARGLSIDAPVATPQLVNLITIPGTQQVLLKVQVAELNRAATRDIGFDFDHPVGPLIDQIVLNGDNVPGFGVQPTNLAQITGVIPGTQWQYLLDLLRTNSIAHVLSEPTLVTLSGHQASFLAGGEFPVPVPQQQGQVTIQFREFGIRLGVIPFVLDRERIRMTVVPEVSALDFTIGTTLVLGGSPVPGLTTRRVNTTVEMRQGQTLTIAGVMQLTKGNNNSRIPGVGDVPYLGTFFSNNNSTRTELELLVAVTPYLAEPMNQDQVPLGPGALYFQPNDLEFFFLNRLESRVGRDHRGTTHWDDRLNWVRLMNLEKRSAHGQVGFPEPMPGGETHR